MESEDDPQLPLVPCNRHPYPLHPLPPGSIASVASSVTGRVFEGLAGQFEALHLRRQSDGFGHPHLAPHRRGADFGGFLKECNKQMSPGKGQETENMGG